MTRTRSVKLVVSALALALVALALPFWLSRDRPGMTADDILLAGLMGSGPCFFVALLAAAAVVRERRLGHQLTSGFPAFLLGMLIGCGCWLLWVLLIFSAESWF